MIRYPSVWRHAILGAAILSAVSAPALADDTILRLSETATVMVAPDQLTATLRAEAVAAQDILGRVARRASAA